MDLLKNPIAKIIGIGLILYFALFANTHDKDSLGNRLSKENLQRETKDFKEKSSVLIKNVVKVKQAQEQYNQKNNQKNHDQTTSKSE